MKRFALFICTILCANVLLAQTYFRIDSLIYEITSTNPSTVEVFSVKYAPIMVNIPATVTYEGATYSVTSIGSSAFYNCRSLTSVTISDSVTSIRDNAFSNCSNLASVTIGNGVTVIEDDAFWCCSSLTSITIPNSVTVIGNSAFSGCDSLTSVAIGNSVTSIGNSAFGACGNLTSITIGSNVTSIGNYAFGGCSFLQNVTCMSPTPPAIGGNQTFPYPNIASLIVPCGSLEAYTDPTCYWSVFFPNRIEEDCSVSLQEVESTMEFDVYPNPTSGKVSLSRVMERVEVIDLAGKVVQTCENTSEINIGALPAGVYHLRMSVEEKTITRMLIKE